MRIEIGGISINYECIGSGAPVLLLHGWGADIAAMMPIANEVARLGKMAVCVDFPGFGKSDLPPAAWGVREYADTTKALIDKLGIRGCDLVCHSFGGRVTIMLAAEDEMLFKRLVLVDAAGIRPKRTIKYYIKTYSYKLAKRLVRIKLVNKAFRLDAKIKSAGSDEYKSLSGVMRETFVKVVNLDLTDKLDKIKNETLLIWGENDTVTPLYMGRLMEKKIERAGLAVIENAGHFSYADDYPRFCSILDIMLMD